VRIIDEDNYRLLVFDDGVTIKITYCNDTIIFRKKPKDSSDETQINLDKYLLEAITMEADRLTLSKELIINEDVTDLSGKGVMYNETDIN
jgi:hypothetical protein